MVSAVKVIALAASGRFDLSAASSFGRVVTLFETLAEANPFRGSELVDEIRDRLERAAYVPNRDAIVLSGPVASVALLLYAAAAMSPTSDVRTLVFDARDGGVYRERSLSCRI